MRRAAMVIVVWAVIAAPAAAQFVVIDPANLAQAILIADRTLREYNTLLQQYETILKMARSLGSLDRYRTPSIAITGHDPSRWPYAAPWLQGLNSGDARGTLYEQVARRVERPGALLAALPPDARRAIEDAYATIELTDSVAEIAGHQVALVRGYNATLQQLVQEFERDVLNTLPRYHEMTAVLDKVATGELLARRQDAATNQLLSHALEQLLARGKRLRDTEAAIMNMRLIGMRDGRTAGTHLIDGSADAVRTWRQP
jgi:Domain of unknown function (DUF4141)